EWYESRESDEVLYAPLLLQPLEIERVSQRGRWRYWVKGTGEEATSNVTLAERLKQDFGLDLPPVAEEDDAETYLGRVEELAKNQQRWRVRRFVTFGLFAFGRLAMWRDLDPSCWPDDQGPDTHPGIATLLAGGSSDRVTVASEYDVDSPDVSRDIP